MDNVMASQVSIHVIKIKVLRIHGSFKFKEAAPFSYAFHKLADQVSSGKTFAYVYSARYDYHSWPQCKTLIQTEPNGHLVFRDQKVLPEVPNRPLLLRVFFQLVNLQHIAVNPIGEPSVLPIQYPIYL